MLLFSPNIFVFSTSLKNLKIKMYKTIVIATMTVRIIPIELMIKDEMNYLVVREFIYYFEPRMH